MAGRQGLVWMLRWLGFLSVGSLSMVLRLAQQSFLCCFSSRGIQLSYMAAHGSLKCKSTSCQAFLIKAQAQNWHKATSTIFCCIKKRKRSAQIQWEGDDTRTEILSSFINWGHFWRLATTVFPQK